MKELENCLEFVQSTLGGAVNLREAAVTMWSCSKPSAAWPPSPYSAKCFGHCKGCWHSYSRSKTNKWCLLSAYDYLFMKYTNIIFIPWSFRERQLYCIEGNESKICRLNRSLHIEKCPIFVSVICIICILNLSVQWSVLYLYLYLYLYKAGTFFYQLLRTTICPCFVKKNKTVQANLYLSPIS